jgi:hypothetical protein
MESLSSNLCRTRKPGGFADPFSTPRRTFLDVHITAMDPEDPLRLSAALCGANLKLLRKLRKFFNHGLQDFKFSAALRVLCSATLKMWGARKFLTTDYTDCTDSRMPPGCL